MSKIIIGVHGLGNKPPKEILNRWWLDSMREGLKSIPGKSELCPFELVYWAGHIYPKPLQPSVKDPDNPYYIEDPFAPRGDIIPPKPRTNRKKLLDYIEKQLDKLLLNEDLSINFSAITDYIIHHFFRDLEIYYTSEHVDVNSSISARAAIQNELINTLLKYRDRDILLLAHSMGSIIAYEVLQELQNKVKIHTFVTFGSPLGIPVIMSKMFAHLKDEVSSLKKLTVPENVIHSWYNLSDLEDRVAMNYNLADDFPPNSKGLRIEDIEVFNDYSYGGQRNPHKSYGYLRTREMSKILSEFMAKDKSKIRIMFESHYHRILRIISVVKNYLSFKQKQ